jgi:hypothetical protein
LLVVLSDQLTALTHDPKLMKPEGELSAFTTELFPEIVQLMIALGNLISQIE